MTDYLFVYGTLTKNNKPNFELMINKMEYVGRGKIRGKLYDLGEYPGVIEHQDGYVFGEIYRINDSKTLSMIDKYEDFDKSNPEKSLYLRKIIDATLEDGTETKVYAYLYNQSIKNMKEIPTGIWKQKNP